MGMLDSMLSGKLVKQMLMGAGVKDPEIFAMVDFLAAGGFDTPKIEAYAGGSFPIQEGSKSMVISTGNPTEELVLLLVRRRKTLTVHAS